MYTESLWCRQQSLRSRMNVAAPRHTYARVLAVPAWAAVGKEAGEKYSHQWGCAVIRLQTLDASLCVNKEAHKRQNTNHGWFIPAKGSSKQRFPEDSHMCSDSLYWDWGRRVPYAAPDRSKWLKFKFLKNGKASQRLLTQRQLLKDSRCEQILLLFCCQISH